MNKRNVRLLHLMKSFDIGGVEKSTIQYSNFLVSKLDFIGIYSSKGLFDKSGIINKNIKRFYPPYNIWQIKHFIQNLCNLITVIKSNNITHIHYHQRIYIPFIFIIKFVLNEKIIIYSHHNIYKSLINYFIISDKIVVLNKSTQNDLPIHLRKKSLIIPHGVKVINRQKKNHKPMTIGYVGRFVKFKGIFNLIESFQKVNIEYNSSKLILIGCGDLKKDIITFIKGKKLEKSVKVIEPKISEDEIYSCIDILVLPSEKLEGFGLVILEAMSHQIPVIVSEFEPFHEIITNNVNGIISKNLHLDLLCLLRNQNVYNNIRENALKLIYEKYDILSISEKYLKEVYFHY